MHQKILVFSDVALQMQYVSLILSHLLWNIRLELDFYYYLSFKKNVLPAYVFKLCWIRVHHSVCLGDVTPVIALFVPIFGSILTSPTLAVSLSPAVCKLLPEHLTCQCLAQGRERAALWMPEDEEGQTGQTAVALAWSGSLISEHSSQTSLTDENRKHAPHHSHDSLQSQAQVCPEGPQTS